MSGPPKDWIVVRGARVNNLKNIDVSLPKHSLVVITGVSGSGKSTLAFDTIFAEGHRRYVEAIAPYARQFMALRARPDVDMISGLSPAIAIERNAGWGSARTTVATATEIYDHLRVLFAQVGIMHCSACDAVVEVLSVSEMVNRVLARGEGARVAVLAPIAATTAAYDRARSDGFVRVSVDGAAHPLDEEVPEGRVAFLFVDRFAITRDVRARVADSLEAALRVGGGVVRIENVERGDSRDAPSAQPESSMASNASESLQGETLTALPVCVPCGRRHPDKTPRLFSFNAPEGACPHCGGLAERPPESDDSSDAHDRTDDGATLARVCPACHGMRLRPEALHVRLAGRSISDVCALSIVDAGDWARTLAFTGTSHAIALPLVQAIEHRIAFLAEVGLGYLTLDRAGPTLSGGEATRVHLASELGAGLSGLLYVLDEPTIGLHPHDAAALIRTLQRLRDAGNSLIVVEHDLEMLRASDFAVEMGPGAGTNGGRVVAAAPIAAFLSNGDSLTAAFAAGRRRIPTPTARRKVERKITLHGVHTHNLKRLTVSFPLAAWTTVTGISGSGKSSLVLDTLYPIAAARIRGANASHLPVERATGLEGLARVVLVDQRPIGRTPRSNPATYSGILTPLRELFASTREARARGYGPARFSFNVRGGRCEACEGDGQKRVTTYLLPEFFVRCDVCDGARYNAETLDIRYRGRSIAEVLALTVDEAKELFAAVPAIRERLATMVEVGLGYLTLGQSAHTLSAGEAQRLRLATELARRVGSGAMYILDEPTTGLHLDDIERLINLLHRLVDLGHTVVVVEHNMEVVKQSDWVVDLGPGAGPDGGRVVFEGRVADLVTLKGSLTAPFLARTM